ASESPLPSLVAEATEREVVPGTALEVAANIPSLLLPAAPDAAANSGRLVAGCNIWMPIPAAAAERIIPLSCASQTERSGKVILPQVAGTVTETYIPSSATLMRPAKSQPAAVSVWPRSGDARPFRLRWPVLNLTPASDSICSSLPGRMAGPVRVLTARAVE